MKALIIKELRTDKFHYEQLIDDRKQLLISQITDLRIEAALATQTNILRLEGALAYVAGNIERLEEESQVAENARMAAKSKKETS